MPNRCDTDLNCVAWWRFEAADWNNPSAGLLWDYSGQGNHLTIAGVTYQPVSHGDDYREGVACADLEAGTTAQVGAYFTRGDTALSAPFPLKSTYAATVKVSVVGWFEAESLPTAASNDGTKGLICKWDSTAGRKSYAVYLYYDGVTESVYLAFAKGYNGGASHEATVHTSPIVAGRWYHVGVTYDDATKGVKIRLWDDTSRTVVEVTDTHSQTIYLSTDGFAVGLLQSPYGQRYDFDGLVDEVAVFKDILTSDEIDLIRMGGYGSSSSSSSSSFSSSSSSSQSSLSSASSSSSFVPLAWPTLSKGVEFDTQELPGSHDITMPLGNGQTKIRPRYKRRPHRWRIRYRLLTLDDRMALERFYHVECRRGKYTCEFQEKGMDQLWLVRWDPDEPVRFAIDERSPGKFRMEGVLLEDCAGQYGSGKYGAQYYDS